MPKIGLSDEARKKGLEKARLVRKKRSDIKNQLKKGNTDLTTLFNDTKLFEEYIAGGIHRVIGGDLDSFLIFFCRLFPLFAVPVLFFWMRGSGFSFTGSFTGAALYAVFLPALLTSQTSKS